MRHRTSFAILAALSVFVAAPVAAEEAAALIARSAGDAGLRQTLVQEGRKASFFCANCHGEAGISRYDEVPNLAGQNPAYVLTQMEAFVNGKRKDAFMEGLMKVLSPREKASVALFYAASPANPAIAKPGPLADDGAAHFQRLCARCHQQNAHGSETFPRLAGQQPGYLRLSLKRYLSMSGERIYPPMTAAITQLGEKNIDAMVEYLGSRP